MGDQNLDKAAFTYTAIAPENVTDSQLQAITDWMSAAGIDSTQATSWVDSARTARSSRQAEIAASQSASSSSSGSSSSSSSGSSTGTSSSQSTYKGKVEVTTVRNLADELGTDWSKQTSAGTLLASQGSQTVVILWLDEAQNVTASETKSTPAAMTKSTDHIGLSDECATYDGKNVEVSGGSMGYWGADSHIGKEILTGPVLSNPTVTVLGG